MRTLRAHSGPFTERPFFTESEIERMCESALTEAGYYPSEPSPVNIDRFIEKYFDVSPQFEDLPPGVLGYSCFDSDGMISMHIATALTNEGTRVAERRVHTTLAHEAGHGLFHSYLFSLAEGGLDLFQSDPDVTRTRILCRDEYAPQQKVHGPWWEIQANMAIGPLLMPRPLVVEAVEPFLTSTGLLGIGAVPEDQRETVVAELSSTFDVNPVVARIRLEGVTQPSGSQLSL